MNDKFIYRSDSLYAEDVALRDIAARFGTPCYVYSRAAMETNWRRYENALAGRSHRLCYAVKANSNLAVLGVFANLGAGFDIVSGGELERVLRAGGNPVGVAFAGVGKTVAELRRALAAGIGCFNVESIGELHRLNQVAAEFGVRAPVALRVNPNVDPKTHPYIATGLNENKFGIPIADTAEVCTQARAMPWIEIVGIGCHIGSQLRDLEPYRESARQLVALADRLAGVGIYVRHLDLGGGLGIRYGDDRSGTEYTRTIEDLVTAFREIVDDRYELWLEPGRSVVGDAGVLLTEVLYLKENPSKRFAVVDAAMNDLMRPALYDAWHNVVPVTRANDRAAHVYDVVGPICESGDFIAKSRILTIAEGDLLAIMDTGAYGFAMSSTYNSRPRAAEVMVDGSSYHLVRARELIEDLMRGESTLASY